MAGRAPFESRETIDGSRVLSCAAFLQQHQSGAPTPTTGATVRATGRRGCNRDSRDGTKAGGHLSISSTSFRCVPTLSSLPIAGSMPTLSALAAARSCAAAAAIDDPCHRSGSAALSSTTPIRIVEVARMERQPSRATILHRGFHGSHGNHTDTGAQKPPLRPPTRNFGLTTRPNL